MTNHSALTPQEQAQIEKENAIIKEMLPFFAMAAFPILLTILIAYLFGPTV